MTASSHLSVHLFLLGLSPDRAGKAFKYDNTVIEFTWLGTISPPKGFMQVHGANHGIIRAYSRNYCILVPK